MLEPKRKSCKGLEAATTSKEEEVAPSAGPIKHHLFPCDLCKRSGMLESRLADVGLPPAHSVLVSQQLGSWVPTVSARAYNHLTPSQQWTLVGGGQGEVFATIGTQLLQLLERAIILPRDTKETV